MHRSLPLFALSLIFTLFTVSSRSQNIALGKNAFSSSNEWDGNNPYMAVDGRGGSNANGTGGCNGDCSRWSSGFSDNQWIYIDLAALYHLTEVKIYWENANGRDFLIQVSNDALDWTTVHTVTGNSVHVNSFNMTGQTARFVRMYGQTRNSGYGFSIWEMEVYGTRVSPLSNNMALGAGATASSEQHSYTAANISDGYGAGSQVNYWGGCTGNCTQWSSANADGEWIYLDLGSIISFTEVVLYWSGTNYARNFRLEVSYDANTWTTAASLDNNFGSVNTMYMLGQTGRYIRMQGIQRNAPNYSLYEMQVFGISGGLPVKMTGFSAKPSGSRNVLDWSAFTDRPTVFEIERSADGRNFAVIGSLDALAGPHEQHFSFTHQDPSPGRNYYRLRFTELGSEAEYSSVVSVERGDAASIRIFPNPITASSFQVDLGKAVKGRVDVTIYNAAGMQVLRQSTVLTGVRTFPVQRNNALIPGVYTIQVVAEGTALRERLMVAR